MLTNFIAKKQAHSSEKLLPGLIMMSMASSSLAAGFGCAKAQSSTEKMICADSSVSKRDGALSRLYAWTLESATQVERVRIIADQKGWVSGVRDTCATVECLIGAYDKRIKSMSSINYDGGTATYNADDDDVTRIGDETRRNLKKVGITRVGACSSIISLDAHSSSYGAFCSLGDQARIEVCYENLAGNLAVNFYGYTLTGSGLASFTRFACPGG